MVFGLLTAKGKIAVKQVRWLSDTHLTAYTWQDILEVHCFHICLHNDHDDIV